MRGGDVGVQNPWKNLLNEKSKVRSLTPTPQANTKSPSLEKNSGSADASKMILNTFCINLSFIKVAWSDFMSNFIYAFNRWFCSRFTGQISHMSLGKWYTKFVFESIAIFLPLMIRPRRRGKYDFVRTLTFALNKGNKIFSNISAN